MTRQSHERDGSVPEWLDLEPLPEADGDGLVTNGSQGSDDGRVRYPKTAAKIRAALGAADLSQTDVSRRIGVQQANLSKIYGGLQAPSLTTLVELMDLLGVGLDDLIDRKEVKIVGVKVRSTKSASARKSQNPRRR